MGVLFMWVLLTLEAVLEVVAEASHHTSLMFLCLIQMSKCMKSDDVNDMMMMIVMMMLWWCYDDDDDDDDDDVTLRYDNDDDDDDDDDVTMRCGLNHQLRWI